MEKRTKGEIMELKIGKSKKDKTYFLRIQLSIQEYDPERIPRIKMLHTKNLQYPIKNIDTITIANLEEIKNIIRERIDKEIEPEGVL